MKKQVLILYGGRSAEHEVSLQSAKNVFDALDRTLYEPVLVGIGKDGVWRYVRDVRNCADCGGALVIPKECPAVTLAPGMGCLVSADGGHFSQKIDVVFPVLHGPFGEDGTIQGMLKIANLPFVGPGVAASACGMDKELTKRLLKEAGIPSCAYITLRKDEEAPAFAEVARRLAPPFFVKPANMGSSVGISKAVDEETWQAALREAFEFDHKLIIEECVAGREIECAVLEVNGAARAAEPGEVKPTHEFYDYEAKYTDENGAALLIPAEISGAAATLVKDLAVKTFTALGCAGLARVDFFLTKDDGAGKVTALVNEINTLPGFTRISMYPKLWEHAGISGEALIKHLIDAALARFEREASLKVNYQRDDHAE